MSKQGNGTPIVTAVGLCMYEQFTGVKVVCEKERKKDFYFLLLYFKFFKQFTEV